jgi:hypothetical protein
MKTHKVEYLIPKTIIEPNPFADVFADIASRMIEDVVNALDSDESLVELAGQASLASMLQQYANGVLTGVSAFMFLKSLAMMKTSNPIQRSENRSYVNIQDSLKEIITSAPDQIEIATKRAEEARLRVIERHKTDNILRLHPKQIDISDRKEEPSEISNIRRVNE